ncbi:hypothetical protein Xoosp13_216 [Xanthomonas phage Xoo-sp13]|nr:hypothetical protein Xoosp13_216 [Xanthomonas phage Xoo-sp13]
MKKHTAIPLITEPHPEGYNGYPFITLIRYNDVNTINIIDNVVNKQIIGYVLDLCAPAGLDEQAVVSIAEDWFYSDRQKRYPLSVEFSRRELSGVMAPILRCYPTEYVTRVIGPLPEYKMGGVFKTKKKRKKSIPADIDFVDRRFK